MTGSILVHLADESGPMLLGLRVRERNTRAVVRAGGTLVGRAEDASIRVPASVAIEPSLFETLASLDAPLRLRAPDGSEIVWSESASQPTIYQLDDDDFVGVSDAAQRRRAERVLLRRTEKSTDGWVSRKINRPQSRFFSRWLLRVGLSPNAASGICLGIGLLCGWTAAQPGWGWLVLTGLLFQFASMFDGVDGEMARVTLRESRFGAAIDSAVDNATYLATLVGFGVGWSREGFTVVEGIGLVLISVLVVLTLFQVLLFVRKYAPDASFVFFDNAVRRAASDASSQGLTAVGIFFRGLRRDLLAFILMWVCLFGSRFFILCLLGVGVVMANYVLWVHRSELVRAAHILREGNRVGAERAV